MKKIIFLICMFTIVFSLAACGEKEGNRTSTVKEAESADGSQKTSEKVSGEVAGKEKSKARNSSVLVAYFSATGNTKSIAKYAQKALACDIYEIEPAIPYTKADLDYGDSHSRSSLEMNNSNARPKISGSIDDMGKYDIVFLGYPIWWGRAPRIISTFLESYSFDGKLIVPFCTSGSSGIGESVEELKNLVKGNVTWLEGKRFNAGTTGDEMNSWINSLELEENTP